MTYYVNQYSFDDHTLYIEQKKKTRCEKCRVLGTTCFADVLHFQDNILIRMRPTEQSPYCVKCAKEKLTVCEKFNTLKEAEEFAKTLRFVNGL